MLESIVNPPTLPPSNNTSEPVICPETFNIKLLFVELICEESNSNPPIVPPVNRTVDPVIWQES